MGNASAEAPTTAAGEVTADGPGAAAEAVAGGDHQSQTTTGQVIQRREKRFLKKSGKRKQENTNWKTKEKLDEARGKVTLKSHVRRADLRDQNRRS